MPTERKKKLAVHDFNAAMIRCQYCGSDKIIKHGWTKSGKKFYCKNCHRTFTISKRKQ